MIRRKFLKSLALAVGSLFVPKESKQEIPFLPTLEWLQEHDKDVYSFSANYNARHNIWTGLVCPSGPGRDWYNERVLLFFENGKWIAVEYYMMNVFGKYFYDERAEWPSWLRRF